MQASNRFTQKASLYIMPVQLQAEVSWTQLTYGGCNAEHHWV